MLDKIIDKLRDYNPSSQGVISQILLAVSEFPQSEKRDLLLQDLLAKFDPVKINADKSTELIRFYMRSSPGDQLRQQIIEKLCRTNFMENENTLARMNSYQRQYLEL